MAEVKELEERLRKVELSLATMKGGLAVGVVVILGYFGVTSWYQIPRNVNSAINEKFGQDAQATLGAALKKADEFLAHDTHDIWPTGSYAILKNGQCPEGFRAVSGHARAFNVFERRDFYLKPAKMGDTELKWHKDTMPHADLLLHVCVRDG